MKKKFDPKVEINNHEDFTSMVDAALDTALALYGEKANDIRDSHAAWRASCDYLDAGWKKALADKIIKYGPRLRLQLPKINLGGDKDIETLCKNLDDKFIEKLLSDLEKSPSRD